VFPLWNYVHSIPGSVRVIIEVPVAPTPFQKVRELLGGLGAGERHGMPEGHLGILILSSV
jgi:hypothetical protein